MNKQNGFGKHLNAKISGIIMIFIFN